MPIHVLSVHRVPVTDADFDEVLQSMCMDDEQTDDQQAALSATRAHFERLRLIVIQITPPHAPIDWNSITQPVPGRSRSDRQVPYDEEPIDEHGGLWAFFLHEVDTALPLLTPSGPRVLPPETPLPPSLAHKKYAPPL